jgi:hypothetical protein
MTDEGRTLLRRALDSGIEQLTELLDLASPKELACIEQGMECLGDVFARAHPDHSDSHFGPPTEGTHKR